MAQTSNQKFGEYTLLRKIAQGGMAEIFLAQDAKGRILALKRILPHLAHEEGFIRMFIDEARIVSHLDHPNIAGIIGRPDPRSMKTDGFYYLPIEYVEGHSLLALSDRARSMRIALPRGLLSFIVSELLAGLAHAHSARDSKGRHLQIVHRDVTPQNVLISYEGGVKLIDFGVAKARARLTQTEAGFTKGKLSYMSPEQARGEDLDGRSDLFSVGIILYEITTGTRLFNKEGPGGVLSAIVNDPIPPPSTKSKDYPRDLEAVVMRALEKDVTRRWQTADDMRDALLRFASRERPKPSAQRLADLVHDLFGEPENKKVLEEARGVAEPTPSGPVPAELVRGASVRVKGSIVPELGTDADGDLSDLPRAHRADETRMMSSPLEVSLVQSKSTPRLAATNASLPAISTPISHEDIPVPEPSLPLRVRLAQWLLRYVNEARGSWRMHRRRYLIGLIAGGAVLLVSLGWVAGLGSWLGSTLGGAADRAREIRRSAGLDQDIPDATTSKPTLLRLVSEPPGALVSVDGLGAGCVTPCELKDQPLRVALEVELALDGYRPRLEKITLEPGEGAREISVSLERAIGSLSVESVPPGAEVSINGKRLKGTTPLTYDGVRAGQPLTIEVRKSGFLPRRWVVVPRDGETTKEIAELEVDQGAIPPGRLDLNTQPSGCDVSIDGSSAGVSPISGFDLRRGDHQVKISCAYHRPEERTVTILPGKTATLKITAEPNVFGYLTVKTVPPGGNVISVNGRKVDGPVEFLRVVPGRHLIEVVNAQLDKRKSMTVDVGPDKRITREIDLLR
ncbi:MAG: serine/threonine protein kinase [Deltaproteobacteria bacterium]|nr:serine/threonine protein kinase [Deltaproteobacteria bacterium]